VETLIALYALMELGVTAVLLHPKLGSVERGELIATSNPQLVLDEMWKDVDLPNIDPKSEFIPPLSVDDEACLAILHTSGSTGKPKAVMLSRRAFCASAAASAHNLRWHDDDRWLLSMPIAHVGGLSIVTRCLIARRTVVLLPWNQGGLES